jgi:signal peptidase II
MARRATLTILALVALVTAGLDLWTKDWASKSLARFEHPMPLTVPDSMDGKTLSELLSAGPVPDAQVSDVLPLGPPLDADPDAMFPVGNAGTHVAYYLFESFERDRAPLVVMSPLYRERAKAEKGTFNLEDWKQQYAARKLTWSDVFIEQFPFLDRKEVRDLMDAGRVHPVPAPLPRLSAGTTVRKGDTYLLTQREIDVIPSFFRFVYAENPGAAWGILNTAPLLVRKIFLQAVSVLAMVLLFMIAWRLPSGQMLSGVALALVFGGALGNFVDRFRHYYVVDFIDMYVGTAHWPTYNVADIGITVGVGLMAIQILRKRSPF